MPHMKHSPSPASSSPSLRLGTWLAVGSPIIAELAAISGFDWLLFDLEHGCVSDAALMNSLQAIRGTQSMGLVRIGAIHPDLIMRALDWGSAGIMMPHVESARQAEQCLEAIHYPPRGRRGFSRSVRAYNYGLRAPSDLPPPVFIAQIESLQGVKEAGAIAATDGVDVLFVGPSDLAHNLAASKHPQVPTYQECLASVVTAARNAGKQAGILSRDISEVPALVALGFTYLAVESDIGILRGSYQKTVANLKSGATERLE